MKNIKMFDLTNQYTSLKEEVMEKLDEVMESSHFILGSHVKSLEEKIADFSHVKYGIGVGNGSDAIHIALRALGIQKGDEVITPSFTFFATGGAIARTGATPVFVDIDPKTYNLNAYMVENAITKKTKAIVPVHLYGQMADMKKIMEIAKRYNLYVIEDAAQAIGSQRDGINVGEVSSAATYSFFPTKNLGAFGDGGMIVTNEESIDNMSRIIRVHGSKSKYHHHILGYNSRLDELQAAILNVKFKHLKKFNESRRKIAFTYNKNLENLQNFIQTPLELDNSYHVYHQYTIRTEYRDELKEHLKNNGIDSMIYYPVPLHLQPVFKDLGYKVGDLPETERATKEVLSLPMYPELDKETQDIILDSTIKFFENMK